MRILILLLGVFILANVVLFLLPTDAEVNNLKYESAPSMNQDAISFLTKKPTGFESVPPRDETVVSDVKDGNETNDKVDSVGDNNSSAKVNILKSAITSKSGQGNVDQQEIDKQKEKAFEQKNEIVNIASLQCYRIGPFLREARMNASGKQLIDIQYKVIEREAMEVLATRVYVGSFDKLSLALQARQELTSKGVNDHFHRRGSDDHYIVSLGIYSKAESALRQQDKFKSLGIKAKIRTEKTRLPKNYWLELPGNITQKQIDSLSVISWGESSVSLGKHTCQKPKVL